MRDINSLKLNEGISIVVNLSHFTPRIFWYLMHFVCIISCASSCHHHHFTYSEARNLGVAEIFFLEAVQLLLELLERLELFVQLIGNALALQLLDGALQGVVGQEARHARAQGDGLDRVHERVRAARVAPGHLLQARII